MESSNALMKEFKYFKKIFPHLMLALLLSGSLYAAPKIDPKSCKYKGHNLSGKVQFVKSFPDLKVQIVSSFPDLKVQMVDSFPSKCGQWKEVSSFPDFKVQIVTSFPDIKIQYVKSFPGIP